MRKEPYTVYMTASRPKKVNRTIELDIDLEQTFLLYERKNGGILWTRDVPLSRDAVRKLWVDITDLLREMDVPFTFCAQANHRYFKACPYELRKTMDFFIWGRKSTWDRFAYDSTAGAELSFFPKSCDIRGAEIHGISLAGFSWSSQKLDGYVQSMEAPCHVDQQTACRRLEEQGPLAKLEISSDRVRIYASMFFRSSFRVEGFGRNWKYLVHNDMFQENDCAPLQKAAAL